MVKTNYVKYGLNLSDGQKESIVRAYKNKTSLTIRLNKNELVGNDILFLTEAQVNKINKSKLQKKGLQLKLSKNQLIQSKKIEGGLIPLAILPALAAIGKIAGAAALSGVVGTSSSMLAKKAIDKISGKGLDNKSTTIILTNKDISDIKSIVKELQDNHIINTDTSSLVSSLLNEKSGGNILTPILMSIISNILPTLSKSLTGKGIGGELFLRDYKRSKGGDLYLKRGTKN